MGATQANRWADDIIYIQWFSSLVGVGYTLSFNDECSCWSVLYGGASSFLDSTFQYLGISYILYDMMD